MTPLQFIIFNPWKVPWNWIVFYQNSFVISPGLLYHLIRRNTGGPPATFEITPSRQLFFNFMPSRQKKFHFTITIVIFQKKKTFKKYMKIYEIKNLGVLFYVLKVLLFKPVKISKDKDSIFLKYAYLLSLGPNFYFLLPRKFWAIFYEVW